MHSNWIRQPLAWISMMLLLLTLSVAMASHSALDDSATNRSREAFLCEQPSPQIKQQCSQRSWWWELP